MVDKLYDKVNNGESLSKSEKDYIRNLSASLDIECRATRCKSFWSDQVIIIHNTIKNGAMRNSTSEDVSIPKMKHQYRKGVRINDRRINQSVMTVKLYEELVSKGFGYLFE